MPNSPRTLPKIPIPSFSAAHLGEKDSPLSELHPESALRAPHSTPIPRLPNGLDDIPRGATPVGTPPSPSRASTPVDHEEPSRSKKKKKKQSLKEKLDASSTTLALHGFKPNVILENSGSVARDHLASERTYLAYVRTSLVLATTGVALVQLFAVAQRQGTGTEFSHVSKFARPLGATLIIFGLMVLLSGVRRYFAIQTALTQGYFPITRVEVTAMAVVLAVIILIVFGILVSPRG